MDFLSLTIADAHDLLTKREVSAVELTEAALERIVAVDNTLKAFLSLDDEGALEQARHADERIAHGNARPLTGVPLAIKDVLCIRGTCSMFQGLRVVTKALFSVDEPIANSSMLVLPTSTASSAWSLATAVAS
jgi:hypothetical protein